MTLLKTFTFLMLTAISLFAYGQEYDTALVIKNEVSSINDYSYRLNGSKLPIKRLTSAFYFDKKGNLIEKFNLYYSSPISRYKYDSHCHLIEQINYKPNKKVNTYYRWTYDSLGNIKTHFSNFGFGSPDNIDYYIYDSNNRLIEVYDLNDKKEKVRFNTFQYYKNGKVKEERFQNLEMGIDRITQYDDHGNVIGRTEKFHNEYIKPCNVDQLQDILSRKIDTLTDKSIKITTTYCKRKTIDVKTLLGVKKSFEEYTYDEPDSTITSSKVLSYNEQGQLIETKSYFKNRIDNDWTESYYHFKYYYYPNGLKKRYDSFNQKGKLTEYGEYINKYYK